MGVLTTYSRPAPTDEFTPLDYPPGKLVVQASGLEHVPPVPGELLDELLGRKHVVVDRGPDDFLHPGGHCLRQLCRLRHRIASWTSVERESLERTVFGEQVLTRSEERRVGKGLR